ncbi:TetR family transcriptional regulator [Streptomyces sp. E5N91]|uniref:TetR/AcrR family transcriptional regulator n=1 Tax=Streptomyces sp. E5N91 TaxID=1851996 RepID=UPI000EF57221|nr:TetR family transcriptional regulator [Streptomyces sp. E5N91]
MQRDAEATKQRLIAAGRAEFAAYGLNGARVDRIADAAQCNKAQIYHYFKNKAGLFEAVWNSLVEHIVVHLPRDAENLPEVAANLSDIYARNPEFPRLITWQRMERGDETPNEQAMEDVRNRSAAIAAAQARGVVSTRFEARVLLALVIHIAMLWEAANPEVLAVVDIDDREERREAVRRVTAALVA